MPGTDVIPFKFKYNLDENKEKLVATMSASINKASNEMKVSATFSGNEAESAYNGNFSVTVLPSKEAIKVEKPANAKTIIQLANDLGFGDLLNSATQSSNVDTNGSAIQTNKSGINSSIKLLFENSHSTAYRSAT
jgi:alpha-amylase/alpha-mannosidase (GH57 family)